MFLMFGHVKKLFGIHLGLILCGLREMDWQIRNRLQMTSNMLFTLSLGTMRAGV